VPPLGRRSCPSGRRLSPRRASAWHRSCAGSDEHVVGRLSRSIAPARRRYVASRCWPYQDPLAVPIRARSASPLSRNASGWIATGLSFPSATRRRHHQQYGWQRQLRPPSGASSGASTNSMKARWPLALPSSPQDAAGRKTRRPAARRPLFANGGWTVRTETTRSGSELEQVATGRRTMSATSCQFLLM